MHPIVLSLFSLLLALAAGSSSTAYGWGERGHHLVTRVAVRLIMAQQGHSDSFAAKLGDKELMLAHLSNVPDTVWRSAGKAVEDANAPTHFIDIEYLATTADYDALPKTPAEGEAAMLQLCRGKVKGFVCPAGDGGAITPDKLKAAVAGTAPWRIQQMFNGMRDAFVASMKTGADKATVDRAWLHAGILSHFVGDLGNPHHTTRDYDGWERGRGGIHSFFESGVVSSFDLGFEQEVFLDARRSKHFERVLSHLPAKKRSALSRDPLAVAFALTLDSHARLAALDEADRVHAVLKPSLPADKAHGMKVRAERRAAFEAAPHFKDLAVERLATAAATLAHLWMVAYEAGGKPDLSWYQSWAYDTQPEFIPLAY